LLQEAEKKAAEEKAAKKAAKKLAKAQKEAGLAFMKLRRLSLQLAVTFDHALCACN